MKARHFNGFSILSWTSLEALGFKTGTVTGMNTALHAPAGVDNGQILENRAAFSRELGVSPFHWTCADQVHGTDSALLSGTDRGRGSRLKDDAIASRDALILSAAGQGALIFTADCLPLVLVDTGLKAGAVIHAGWRGIAGGIVPKVLERMCGELGSKKEDIHAAAGPAIDSCCYQIDRPVYDAVISSFPETEPAFSPDGDDHWRFSLEKAVFLQLEHRGIGRDRMEGSGLCTACSGTLSSWRREGPSSGRMGTFLTL